jgi:hypothetical protein
MSDATPTTEAAAVTEQPKNWGLIAQEAFGGEFKGEVTPDPGQPNEPAPDDTNTEVTADPAKTDEAAAAAEEKPISSIEELAEHYGLDPEWLESLETKTKVNGAEGAAKIGDLKKSYQIISAAEQRLEESKAFTKAERQAIAQKREQLTGEFSKVAVLIEQAEKLILADESKIDWNKLRDSDPAEWTAKRTEFTERRNQVNALKNSAIQTYQSTAQSSEQEIKAQQAQYLQEQSTLLMSKVPEWKDAEVAKKEKQEIAAFLLDQGFTKEDLAAASDHRMILMARKAMLFDKGQDKTAIAQKKVLTIPKVLKAGATKSPAQINAANLAALAAKAKRTGSIEDAQALLRAKRGS